MTADVVNTEQKLTVNIAQALLIAVKSHVDLLKAHAISNKPHHELFAELVELLGSYACTAQFEDNLIYATLLTNIRDVVARSKAEVTASHPVVVPEQKKRGRIPNKFKKK